MFFLILVSLTEGKSWWSGLFEGNGGGSSRDGTIDGKNLHGRNVPLHNEASPPRSSDLSGLRGTLNDLQIPCGYIVATTLHTQDPSTLFAAKVNPVETKLDPSLSQSTIRKSVVLGDRYLKLLSEEGGIPGYIPAEAVYLRMGSLEATVSAPLLKIIEDEKSLGNYDLLLGRDFMRQNKAEMDLEDMEVHIVVANKKVMVPFIQKRPSSPFGGSEEL